MDYYVVRLGIMKNGVRGKLALLKNGEVISTVDDNYYLDLSKLSGHINQRVYMLNENDSFRVPCTVERDPDTGLIILN